MKCNIKKVLLFFLMANLCLSLNTIVNYASPMSSFSNNSVDEEEKSLCNEWVESNGFYYYYGNDGKKIKNEWIHYSNNWFHVDKDGKMQKSTWISDANNDWFYVGSDGTMQKSKWIESKYYVNDDGKMIKNAIYLIGNKKYCFDNNGIATEIQQESNVAKSSSNSSNYSNKGSDVTVYVSGKGKRYHSRPGCSNMKSPTAISESAAISRGYSACNKCW